MVEPTVPLDFKVMNLEQRMVLGMSLDILLAIEKEERRSAQTVPDLCKLASGFSWKIFKMVGKDIEMFSHVGIVFNARKVFTNGGVEDAYNVVRELIVSVHTSQ